MAFPKSDTGELADLLVVSSWAPPTIGGTPTVLRSFLRALCARHPVRVQILRQRVVPEAPNDELLWDTTTLMRPKAFTNMRGGHYALAPRVFATVVSRLRKRKMLVLLTHPEESFALASAAACRLTGNRYALYMHNTYADQALHPVERLVAPLAEAWLLRHASPLLVLTDALHDLYLEKYGLESTVIPHILDEELIRSASASDLPPDVEPGRYALFSGDVYAMNADSLRRLGQVLRENFSKRLQFVVCGQKSGRELAGMGITPDVVVVGAAAQTLAALQKNAAILLAPLAFDSPFPEEVSSALPTKVIEYLAAGPPILVHAPARSFLTARARAERWGAVVSTPAEAELRATIARLLDDSDLRASLRANARKASLAYSAETAVQAFLGALEADTPEAAGQE